MIITPEKIQWLRECSPVFEGIYQQHGAPPNWQRPPGFETLLRIILEQQVSLESAYAAYSKLRDRLVDITPDRVLSLSDEEMRACYISRQKIRYLRILAQAIIDRQLDLPMLAVQPEPIARATLTALIGIGNWTADIYLLFCLQAPDILPLGDVAIITAIRNLFAVDKPAIPALSETWQPYRSTAAYFLWHHYLCKRNREISHLV